MEFQTNDWKLSIRNLIKQRRTSTLNIIGLAFGFAVVLFLGVYVNREFTYDAFHKNVDTIFKPEFEITEAKAQIDIASNLSLEQIVSFREDVPGIVAITFLNYSRWDWDNGAWIEYNGNRFNIEHLAFSDKYFDEVFSFQTHSGNLSASLDAPDKLVLSKDISDKIFGNENPVGKVVLLNEKPIAIGSILESIPANSSIQICGLVSHKSASYFFGNDITDWSNIPFIRVKENSRPLLLSEVMSRVMRNTLPEEAIKKIDPIFSTNLVPLKKLYFHERSPYDPIKHGSKSLAYIMLGIGIVILFLAIINYSNLLLATSLKWKKDFGIQQLLGADMNTERKQLFIKGFVISIIAFCASIIIINFALPWYNQLVNYPLQGAEFFKFQSFGIAIGLLLFTIFFSGIIPTFFNKHSSPLNQIKGDMASHKNSGGIWKTLVTFQLFISISLIIASLIITKQINYGLNKDIGITVKNVVTIPTSKLGNKQEAYINAVSDHVQTVSNCRSTSYMNTFNIWGGKIKEPDKEEQNIEYNIIRINNSFLQTLGLELIEGRDFMKNNSSDNSAIIVNKALLKQFNIKKPLESTIRGFPIVGVVKDFNFNSLHHTIEPVVLWNTPDKAGLSSILFAANNKADVKEYMGFLESEWRKLDTGKPFECEFLDERLADMYKNDITLVKSVSSFSILAIFIACLGIFGLLSYIIEIRIKEIGIRKVNGAKVSEILSMLNLDLIKWIAIAFVIATPIAYYAMYKWLENFAYKTNLSWWIFALAGVLALGIALLTVSWQSWRAATRNPVEALRYE